MHEFETSLELIQQELSRAELVPLELIPEPQNKDYGGGRFKLGDLSIRYRVAKTTPKKIGQFVAFWQKLAGKNSPYSDDEGVDLFVINTFTHDRYGQFVFPREVLIKQEILTQGKRQGKMGIRVYPIWDHPISSQAQATQRWQLPYFIEFGQDSEGDSVDLRRLYLSE